MNIRIVCIFAVIALVLNNAGAKDIYLSDFGKGLGGWHVTQLSQSGMKVTTDSTDTVKAVQKVATKEGFQLTVDGSVTGPSGQPALRIHSATPSSGRVGIIIDLPSHRRLDVKVHAAADHQQPDGRVQLAMICYPPQGEPGLWINVPWMGQNHLPKTTQLQEMRGLIQVPDFTARIVLFVQPLDFVGDVWLADVAVSSFDIDPKLDKELTENVFRPTGPKKYGATGWFVYDVVSVRDRVVWIEDPTMRDTTCKLLRAAGLTVSRTTHFWEWLEPEPGRYDFARLDREVNDMLHYGVETALAVHGVPAWAHGKTKDDLPPEKRGDRIANTQPFFPPKDWGDYERFITKLATHFKGRVKIWECMNEPDTNLSGFNYEYHDYLDFSRHFYKAVKGVDPDNHVMAARVGGPWLPLLIEEGLTQHCDSITTHPYHRDPLGAVARTQKCHLYLAEAGIAKPVYVTEVGWTAGAWPNGPGPRKSEQAKAHAGREAMEALSQITDWIIWYDAMMPKGFSGLLQINGDRRQHDGDNVRPTLMYYEMGDFIGDLKKSGGPVHIDIVMPTIAVAKGQQAEITLIATNTSQQALDIKFWPVGFVTALGGTIDQIRRHDWQGRLQPGQSHRGTLTITPTDATFPSYKVGLAVVSDEGNSLWLEDVYVIK